MVVFKLQRHSLPNFDTLREIGVMKMPKGKIDTNMFALCAIILYLILARPLPLCIQMEEYQCSA